MAVPQQNLFAALKDCEVETRFCRDSIRLRYKGKSSQIRRYFNPADEYKIGEVRHLVGQLNLDSAKVKVHIPAL